MANSVFWPSAGVTVSASGALDGDGSVGDPLAVSVDGVTITIVGDQLVGAASGAPTTATYITQTANAGLSAEQALGALASGLLKNTTTTGVLSVIADGTVDQVLSTDGAGTLSFQPVVQSTTIITNNIKFANGKGLTTDIHTNDTLLFQAFDVDDAVYRTFATLTAGNTPSFNISAPSGGVITGVATIQQFGITIDGAGSVITTGVKGFIVVPYACTITQATLLSTDASVTSGSIVIDVWKDTYANYPPTVADTITASAKPTLSSAIKSQDATLTGWTTTVAAGSVLGFNVDSATTVTRVTLMLQVRLT